MEECTKSFLIRSFSLQDVKDDIDGAQNIGIKGILVCTGRLCRIL